MYGEQWRKLKEGILALEEEGSWISQEDSLKDDCNDGGVNEVAAHGEERVGDGVHVRDEDQDDLGHGGHDD